MIEATTPVEKQEPNGIGGWLLVPIIEIILSITLISLIVLQDIQINKINSFYDFFRYLWSGVEGTSHHERVINRFISIIYLTMSCFFLLLIFLKSKLVFKYNILYYAIKILLPLYTIYSFIDLILLDYFFPGEVNKEYHPLGYNIFFKGIAITTLYIYLLAYFQRSKRVRNTFSPKASP